METLTALERIKRVRITTQQDKTAFFGYLLMYLNPVETPKFGTMGVDQKGNLYYDPEWVNSLTEEQLRGTLIHEILHLALETFLRKGNRDAMIISLHADGSIKPTLVWNLSSDFAINLLVKQNGMELPPNVCYDEKYNNWMAEEIYDDLMKKFKNMPKFTSYAVMESEDKLNGEQEGEGQLGKDSKEQVQSKAGKDKNSGEEKEKEGEGEPDKPKLNATPINWRDKLIEAALNAKARGCTPLGMDRFFEKSLFPKANWRALLRRFVSEIMKSDYTFNRPNRRFIHSGLYLPSKVQDDGLELILGIDTSGSISQDDLSQFYAEVISIRDAFNCKLTVITCDAQIHEVIKVKNHEKLDIKMKGGGGTDMCEIFRYIDEKKLKPKVVIVLTDGYTPFPAPKDIRFPTVWAISEGGVKTIPQGIGLKIELN